jgi:bacterial/archaeal transporter family protein
MNWIHWSLLSAVFAGITAILVKAGASGVNPNLAIAIRTTVILVFTWGIVIATTGSSSWIEFPRKTWALLIFSGIATGLSWLCYIRALQLGEASRVAPVEKLSVIFTVVFAALFLGEKITPQHLIGCTLVASGAIILAWES